MATAAELRTGDDFEVAVSRHPGVDVVSVRGELDLATAGRVREVALDPDLCPQPGLVVDLTGVGFLDSTGIGALVASWRRTSANAKRFGVACPPGLARRVLDLVELHQVMPVWDSLEQALDVLELG